MNLKQFLIFNILVVFLLPTTYANPIEVVGSIPQTIQNKKIIELMKVELSDEERSQLSEQAQDASAHKHQFVITTSTNLSLPHTVELGMNNVPVLDQGIHGSCTTFAITAALDTVIGKGDYISQICNLQLGSYLAFWGYNSGWNGITANQLLQQIEQYGIVNVDKQRTQGCGGLTEYPTYSAHSWFSYIYPSEFSGMSESVLGTIVNIVDVDVGQDKERLLDDTKEILHTGDRLVFTVLLPRTDLGTVGAVGKHHTQDRQDTWLLTPEILGSIKRIKRTQAAHELVITGYEDDAEAVDSDGNRHKGLLILRNSWGTAYGDKGNFYMTYDYFKLLGYDIKRISKST